MDWNRACALLVAILIALLSGYIIGGDAARKVLLECEKDLPRSQMCHLTAIPDEVKK